MSEPKFHLNKKGLPDLCDATQRACPLGGAHFDTIEDAMKASMAKEMDGGEEPTPPKLTQRQWDELAMTEGVMSDAEQEAYLPNFLTSLDKDPRGANGTLKFGETLDDLSENFLDQLEAHVAKPPKHTKAQEKNIQSALDEAGVTKEEVDQWLGQYRLLQPQIGERTVNYHPSRSATIMSMLDGDFNSRDGGYGIAAREYQVWKQSGKLTENAFFKQREVVSSGVGNTSDSSSSGHYHGAWFGKSQPSGSTQQLPAVTRAEAKPEEPGKPKKSQAQKDAEFREFLLMLTKMYKKKFGTDPEHDGIKPPVLIKMFNDGELNS